VSIRPSVCLPVRPSHAGIVSKRLNTESRKQSRTIAQGQEYGVFFNLVATGPLLWPNVIHKFDAKLTWLLNVSFVRQILQNLSSRIDMQTHADSHPNPSANRNLNIGLFKLRDQCMRGQTDRPTNTQTHATDCTTHASVERPASVIKQNEWFRAMSLEAECVAERK